MAPSLFDLTGKTALVTGSSGGLGFTIARGLGQSGARLILNGRNEQKLEQAVATLQAEGLAAHGNPFDVRNEEQIGEQVSRIQNQLGPIDILVNNAGVQRRGSLETIDQTTWQEVLDINLTGIFLTSKQVVPGMIERRAGKIINICSLMSEVGRITVGPYTAAKGGVRMLTKAMAVDWGKHNIQVNGIGPGYFITEMTQVLADDPEFDGWLKARTPAGRWGRPEELVGTACFLASRASDFVNGQIIYVDGGILASL